MNSADKIFQLFSFQYKPLEDQLLKQAPKDFVDWYKKLPSDKRIRVLDKLAATMGL